MEFSVLGPIEVRDGENVLDIGPRMPRALLAVLLLEPGRVVSVDRLIDALWGPHPPPAATNSLQVYVSQLRRVLEPGRLAGAPPAVLVTQPPGYVLRIKRDAVDAERFAALVREGQALLRSDDPGAAATALRAAAALWRGHPYADVASEPWATAEVGRLTELWAAAREALAEAELALGNHAGMVAELERLAAEDPLRERRWELLGLALYRSGRQIEALRVLRKARDVLDDVGIEPGAPLRRLEDAVLQQSPSLDWQPPGARVAAVAPAAAPEPGPGRPAPGSVSAPGGPIVGREIELAELHSVLEDTIAGRSRVAAISGEPGIGKTRLAEELAAYAQARGVRVAWGRAPEGDAAPSYWPWVQIVRSLAAGGAAADAAELGRLVPEFRSLAGVDAAPLRSSDPETARTRLYDAVVGLVLGAAAERPVLLVIDDLHFADVPTLQLVQLLIARLPRISLFLVVTYREHEASASPAVGATLGTLARAPDLLRIRPGGLTGADIGALIAQSTGEEAPPKIVEAIRERTDGNPFFVSELVRLLRDKGNLAELEVDDLGSDIPLGVRDVIRQRLGRLPADASSLLGPAAVTGRAFDLAVASAAGDVNDERALELIEAAMGIGVVAEEPGAVGCYRFSHVLVRETIYDGLSSLRRARLHRAVGAALAAGAAPDDDRAAVIADHFFAAVAAGATDEAYEWALRAAARAARVLAFEQAEHLLDRAVDLGRRASARQDALRRELSAQRRLASVVLMKQWYAGPDVAGAWARAVDLGVEVEDAAEVLPALWGAWSYRHIRADLAGALDVARAMQARADRTGELPFRVVGDHCAGLTFAHLGRFAESVADLERVGEAVGGLPAAFYEGPLFEPDVRLAHTLFRGLVACVTVGPSGCDVLDAGLADARHLGRPLGLVTALLLAGLGRVIFGDRAAAEALAAEGLVLAEEQGFRLLIAMVDMVGRWAQSDAAGFREALAQFEGTGSRVLLPLFLGMSADVERIDGRWDGALAMVERALVEAASTGERFWEAELLRQRGELLADGPVGRRGEAAKSFAAGLAVAREQGARVLVERFRDRPR